MVGHRLGNLVAVGRRRRERRRHTRRNVAARANHFSITQPPSPTDQHLPSGLESPPRRAAHPAILANWPWQARTVGHPTAADPNAFTCPPSSIFQKTYTCEPSTRPRPSRIRDRSVGFGRRCQRGVTPSSTRARATETAASTGAFHLSVRWPPSAKQSSVATGRGTGAAGSITARAPCEGRPPDPHGSPAPAPASDIP